MSGVFWVDLGTGDVHHNDPAPWQPIETAPKDGTTIVIWPHDSEHATAYWKDGWRIQCCGQMAYPKPTHWMPLPELPK